MNDREFIELLNLYVDHEISAEDSLRLEAEVVADPRRREVYDQYCRIQKACSMLSEEQIADAASAQATPNLLPFPSSRSWRHSGPLFAGLAAAAAVAVAVVSLRSPSNLGSPDLASAGAKARVTLAVPGAAPARDAMKPVFLVHLPSDPSSNLVSVFSAIEPSSQTAQFNWIGDVHMAPVFNAAKPGTLLNPKTDLKAAAISDGPNGRDDQESEEMTAFRFER